MPEFKNVFLDFLNRDSRQIYGLFENTSKDSHIDLLTEALNVSVFLCWEYCVVPPGFPRECDLAREALSLRSEYLDERIIRFPLRERTFDELWEKKEAEYNRFRDKYTGLYDPKTKEFLKDHSTAIMPRSSHVKSEIVEAWQIGPDISGIWDEIKQDYSATEVEKIRQIPRDISREGLAVTWPEIEQKIITEVGADPHRMREVLQHDYFSVYMKELDLRLISDLPFARTDFSLSSPDLGYNYEALKSALLSVGLWSIVRRASAPSLISLRTKAGYFAFREAFDLVASSVQNPREVARIFALAGKRLFDVIAKTKFLDRFPSNILPPSSRGWELTNDEIDAIAYRLDAVAPLATQTLKEQLHAGRVQRTVGGKRNARSLMIAIYVALEVERRILVKRWKLDCDYNDQVCRGKLGPTDFDVIVFGTDEMGRVPAAISTIQLLNKSKPDILLVAGIAGGFEMEGVNRGDVIVATNVADLATRKMRQGKRNTIPEFRPREFRTDKRLEKFLKSSSFDGPDWQNKVLDAAEWPDGLRPTIRYGPIASLDEVVSSTEWVKGLLTAWPKMLGVEMEAGGVCAAAEAFDQKVAVIRGVSDLADPSKSDDEWRRRAMKTVASLLEHIDFNELLTDPRDV